MPGTAFRLDALDLALWRAASLLRACVKPPARSLLRCHGQSLPQQVGLKTCQTVLRVVPLSSATLSSHFDEQPRFSVPVSSLCTLSVVAVVVAVVVVAVVLVAVVVVLGHGSSSGSGNSSGSGGSSGSQRGMQREAGDSSPQQRPNVSTLGFGCTGLKIHVNTPHHVTISEGSSSDPAQTNPTGKPKQ